MGGRSATSGIIRFGRKSGTRLSPKQFKEAVSDQADFIFKELEQNEAIQKVIRKSFRGNTTEITLTEPTGSKTHVIEELDRFRAKFEDRLRSAQKLKKTANTWSEYDVARARMQAFSQVIDEIKKYS